MNNNVHEHHINSFPFLFTKTTEVGLSALSFLFKLTLTVLVTTIDALQYF